MGVGGLTSMVNDGISPLCPCVLVFIFTAGSSALSGCPCCG